MTTKITVSRMGKMTTTVVNAATLDRIRLMVDSYDREMNCLGVTLFYKTCNVWDNDTNIDEYTDMDIARVRARIHILNRRYLQSLKDRNERRKNTANA